jgi:hypothetical protein
MREGFGGTPRIRIALETGMQSSGLSYSSKLHFVSFPQPAVPSGQLSKPGHFTSVRFPFAFLLDDE